VNALAILLSTGIVILPETLLDLVAITLSLMSQHHSLKISARTALAVVPMDMFALKQIDVALHLDGVVPMPVTAAQVVYLPSPTVGSAV